MGWLLVKDLQILRRSPLLVGLLIVYPIVIASLIGFALSRGPDKPKVAFLNQVEQSDSVVDVGGEEVDTDEQAEILFRSIEPVMVDSREEAIELVRSGDVLGALIIPPDITEKLEAGTGSATVEVFYNAEDPVKARFVRDTIQSRVQEANVALTRQFTEIAIDYLGLIVTGGEFSFLGRDFQVLGLERAEGILRAARDDLPEDSPVRDDLTEVIEFAGLARDNLDLSDDVLASVGQPIKVEQTLVRGDPAPLSSFAVAIAVTISLMFVTVLLAAGMLALEREENAFSRLVRGLVSREGLLGEKAVLSALIALVVSLLMLVALGVFVDLEWSRVHLWVAALAAAGLAFAAMGLAIGVLAREVRAASLLAFMISLPIAFLALVPSGAVSGALYDAIRVVSAIFPFDPALDALNAAINDSGGLGGPLLHLLAVFAGFGALARLGLRRFA